MNRTYQKSSFERAVRQWYIRWLRPRLANPLHRQRIKLFWFCWGYAPMVLIRNLPLWSRLSLIARFLRIDWNVLHAHRPGEIACICRPLAERPAAKMDYDTNQGTAEVLWGVVPAPVPGGLVFSPDFRVESARKLLQESSTWAKFHRGVPEVEWLNGNLASVSFRNAVSAAA